MPTSNFNPDAIPDLTGKVFVVTGGNAGIGKSTVVGLAKRGAKVYMGARSEAKAFAAIEEIKGQLPEASIQILLLDLGSFGSVVAAAREVKSNETKLHGLVNNAGIMGVPYEVTTDGYESQFQTNYLSHWLLTYHLLPLLLSTARSTDPGGVRIINLTSDGHSLFPPKEGIKFDDINLKSSSSMTRYGQSKLANLLHLKELHRRYGPASQDEPQVGEIWTAAVHPGHINTDLNRQATASAPSAILRIFTSFGSCVGILATADKGSMSSLFAVASSDFKRNDAGGYIIPYARISTPSDHGQNSKLASKLWDWTADELGKKGLL
ncbi:hypothetical protein N7510_005173 [Penicillium lagena]|uniref:uncharacterized protein n=1 Tax=Penicillium lagena TaxID=94218 RepID=UPI00253F9F07|nr:uncharacterized protein N7510_005173 [Penicillium lagena]KAJ5611979.1 hypothetical protein N7510_005173 [Penicillium lagena]